MDRIMVREPKGKMSRVWDLSAVSISGTATDGSLIKAGTSAATKSCGTTADMKFIALYTESEAVSGDARGIYNRLYISGAGGGGESLRSFTTVNDVAAANAHGAHVSLSFAATGTITGQGIASRNTLHIPDKATWTAGTLAALEAEIWSDGAASDTGSASEVSFIRVVNGGHANGIADVDDDAFLIAMSGGAIGTGNVVQAETDETKFSHKIRCDFHGTTMYLMACDS